MAVCRLRISRSLHGRTVSVRQNSSLRCRAPRARRPTRRKSALRRSGFTHSSGRSRHMELHQSGMRRQDLRTGRLDASCPERADECPSCGAPVLEVVSCTRMRRSLFWRGSRQADDCRRRCATRRAMSSPSTARAKTMAGSDDADDAEDEAAQPEEETVFVQDRLFAANPTAAARGFWLDKKAGWRVVDSASRRRRLAAVRGTQRPARLPAL